MLSIFDVIVFVGLFAVSFVLLSWWRDMRKAKNYNYPPSLPALPLVGSLPFIHGYGNLAKFLMEKSEQLGPIFILKVGNRPLLVLNSTEVIEEAYIKNTNAFSGRSSSFTSLLQNPDRKGLLMARTDEEWKKYHKLSLNILKELGFGVKNIMETRIQMEIEAFENFVKMKNGRAFDPNDYVTMISLNVLTNMVFGHRDDYEKGICEIMMNFKVIIESTVRAFDLAPMVRFLPFYRNKMHKIIVHGKKVEKIIQSEIRKCSQRGCEDCFVHWFINKEGPNFDEEQLFFIVRDLLLAGADTTSNSIQWAMIAFANHPDIQERLRQEIDAVIPRDKLPILEDQKKLPFMEATILEVMRWRTVVPLSLPRVTMTDAKFRGYHIPTGIVVFANLYAAHMSPKVWKDPEAFRPGRFMNDEGKVTGKPGVIPFSLGRRSCFGEVLARAELFLIITSLVQRFIILPREGEKAISAKPAEPVSAIMKPLPFDIRLISRT